ncbi:MAG: A/G-specific adenine glycosylase [Alphaproteobacteria bacterium]|nr:A/G-specific adenine glycosylase [Alphaproteobacteria bacterium]
MPVNRPGQIRTAVDKWYAAHARVLPWRIGPAERAAGQKPDPYLVWLSEIMLQQTTVPHAAPYFERFRARWPTVHDLAAAGWDEVSEAWAGLGYYSRARNLHACAKQVAARDRFPQDRDGLLALPGVGPYTAAAIAAIAFDQPVAPVDGNIERVVSRLFAIGSDGSEGGWRVDKKAIAAQAQALFDGAGSSVHPGDLAQGLMDLGASICTPRKPACAACPLHRLCAAYEAGEAERFPVKPAKADRPARYGSAFVLLRGPNVMLLRRPQEGLLGGMLMPPTGAWLDAPLDDPLEGAPGRHHWEPVGEVRHVFTHFSLRLAVWRTQAGPAMRTPAGGVWLAQSAALAALPTVGRKAVRLALP